MSRKPKPAPVSAYVRTLASKIGGRHPYFADAIGQKNIAVIIQEAFEEHGIVQRLAERVSLRVDRQSALFDPYSDLTPAQREFVENMDVWTLENVIVRVLTDLERRREKYIGGAKKQEEREGIR